MIGKLVETPVVRRARYLFVGVLYLILILAAYGAAALQGWLDHKSPPAEPHSVEYYRTIFSIWATIVLVTGAVLSRLFAQRRRQHLLARVLDFRLSGVPGSRLLGGVGRLRRRP